MGNKLRKFRAEFHLDNPITGGSYKKKDAEDEVAPGSTHEAEQGTNLDSAGHREEPTERGSGATNVKGPDKQGPIATDVRESGDQGSLPTDIKGSDEQGCIQADVKGSGAVVEADASASGPTDVGQADSEVNVCSPTEAQSRDTHHEEAQSPDTHHEEAQSRDTHHEEAQSPDTHHEEAQSRDTHHEEAQSDPAQTEPVSNCKIVIEPCEPEPDTCPEQTAADTGTTDQQSPSKQPADVPGKILNKVFTFIKINNPFLLGQFYVCCLH